MLDTVIRYNMTYYVNILAIKKINSKNTADRLDTKGGGAD